MPRPDTHPVGATPPADPVAVVRLAGLTLPAASGVASTAAWDAALARLRRVDALTTSAPRLADALHAVIGTLPDGGAKPRVVALRRRIHRGKVPSAAEWDDEVRAALGPVLTADIDDWLGRLQDLRAATDNGADALDSLVADDRAVETTRLLALARDPGFRHALAQAGPSLAAQLAKLDAVGEPVTVKTRTLLGLTRYVFRAATKTSPYSTFTATAPVTWLGRTAGALPADADTGAAAAGRADVRCVVELDRLVVDHVVRRVVATPSLAAHLAVRVNPSLARDGDQLVVLGPLPDEPVVRLPDSETVRQLLAAAGTGATLASFRDDIAARTGRGADAAAACDRLVALGAVEVQPPVDDQSETPLDDLLTFLQGVPAPDVPGGLVDALRTVRDTVDQPVTIGDVDALRRQRERSAAALSRLGEVLGLSWPTAEVLQKVALHENAVRPADLTLRAADWDVVLADLQLVRSWLAVHDRMLPTRLALAEYVRRGGAERVGFVALHARLQHDLAAPAADDPAWFAELRPFLQLGTPADPAALAAAQLPSLCALREARRRSAELAAQPTVTREDVRQLAATFPSGVRTEDSATAYVQPIGSSDELAVVVNTVSGGLGKAVGRWRRLLRQAGATTLPGDVAAGSEVCELSGVHTASVNLRDPVAGREIDYPFTTSDRPAAERIALGDLVVGLNADDRLSLATSTGDAVRPVHLGMMADPLLPPSARLLVAAFGQSYLLHPSLGLFRPPAAPDEVQRLSRLTVGRVVVRRAELSFPVADVPRRNAGESDAQFLLRLARWTDEQAVPRRFFLRVVPTDGDWVKRVFVKSRKPLFVDLGSAALRAVFEHTLQDATGRVVLEEALPDPVDAVPFVHDEPRVAEFAIEIAAGAS